MSWVSWYGSGSRPRRTVSSNCALYFAKTALAWRELLLGPADLAGLAVGRGDFGQRRLEPGGLGVGVGRLDEDGDGDGLEFVEQEQFGQLAVGRLHRAHVRGQPVGGPGDERADAADHQAEAEQQLVAQTPATGHREPPCSGRRAGGVSSPGATGGSLPEDFLQWESNFYPGRADILTTARVPTHPRFARLPVPAGRSTIPRPRGGLAWRRRRRSACVCFVSLFAVVEPLGLIPIFIGMTAGLAPPDPAGRRPPRLPGRLPNALRCSR